MICRICGQPGEGQSFQKWVRDTFTNWDLLHPGEIICEACAFWFEQRSAELQARMGKDKPQRMQNYSHFVRGIEWTQDLIGNSGDLAASFTWNESEGVYYARQDTVEWWQAYIESDAEIRRRVRALADEFGESYADLLHQVGDELGNDYEDHHDQAMAFLDDHEASRRMERDWLTPAEAAAHFGGAEVTWRTRAAAGLIPGAVKKGKQWLFPRSAVER
jgi:hypothetical protein